MKLLFLQLLFVGGFLGTVVFGLWYGYERWKDRKRRRK